MSKEETVDDVAATDDWMVAALTGNGSIIGSEDAWADVNTKWLGAPYKRGVVLTGAVERAGDVTRVNVVLAGEELWGNVVCEFVELIADDMGIEVLACCVALKMDFLLAPGRLVVASVCDMRGVCACVDEPAAVERVPAGGVTDCCGTASGLRTALELGRPRGVELVGARPSMREQIEPQVAEGVPGGGGTTCRVTAPGLRAAFGSPI